MGDLLALEIGERLVGAVLLHHHRELVAAHLLGRALGRERHRACHVDGKAGRAGREAGDVQPPRAHRLDLGRVRLDRVVDHPFARASAEMIGERLEDVLVDGGILDRGVGENERGGIAQLRRIARRVGDEIAVGVAIELVELASVRARALRQGRAGKRYETCDADEHKPLEHRRSSLPFGRLAGASFGLDASR